LPDPPLAQGSKPHDPPPLCSGPPPSPVPKHFVTVELGFMIVDGKKHFYPVTREPHPSNKPKLEYLGTTGAKGQDLITKAVAVMKTFGKYFKFAKNCQDFCNMYVEAIGVKGGQRLTDCNKVELTSMLAGIIAFLFVMLK